MVASSLSLAVRTGRISPGLMEIYNSEISFSLIAAVLATTKPAIRLAAQNDLISASLPTFACC